MMLSSALIDIVRKLPCGLSHARMGKRCFSQEGEDMVLARVFENKSSGVYVDVGAHHPIRFSNTYMFYLRGWSGVNVDGMPGSMDVFRRMRPRDRNIEALISSKPGALTYHLFNDPAMNTCDPQLARQRDGLANFRQTGAAIIKSHTLASILEIHLGESREIDFMSVDVEGMDLDVLQSNNWRKFRPTVILAEDFGLPDLEATLNTPTATFLAEHGYVLFAKTVNTLFFRQNELGGTKHLA